MNDELNHKNRQENFNPTNIKGHQKSGETKEMIKTTIKNVDGC